MKTLFAILLVSFILSCSEKKVDSKFLTFELRLAESESKQNLTEMIFYKSDQKFFVYDSVFLNNENIKGTEIIDWETHPKVLVTLNENGRKKFADFTLNNIGKNAAMIVDGKLVSAPRINAQITKGILIIHGILTHEESQKIAGGIIPKN